MKFFFLFLLVIPQFLFSQNADVGSRPAWVKKLSVNMSSIEEEKNGGAIRYLLIDYQDHVDKAEGYVHLVYQLLNDEGVQSYSNISIDFDPTFQKLFFHEVTVHRNGQVINKLSKSGISTIQRESDMSRNLYDGGLTSYINLDDVRAGDVVEYSYTITGFNPVFDGRYSSSFYQDYSVPVEDNSIRIISSKPLYFSAVNGGEVPTRQGNEYVVRNTPQLILYEDNTPGWYYPFRLIAASNFESWSEVREWAEPLYLLNQLSVDELRSKTMGLFERSPILSESVTNAIRFVQDEVRYLGFESGIRGYQPTRPDLVLERRFGDCKDKSNLLVGILRGMEVEAFPMLVHSSKKHMLDVEQPSPVAFDHCVVNFKLEGEEYYVDPTSNNQGGDLSSQQFPNYQRGLVIKEGENDLRELGFTNLYKQRVKEVITVGNLKLGGGAKLDVSSTYFGANADYIRNYFDNNTRAQITKEYTSFYSNLYRDIEAIEEVEIIDNQRSSSNEVVVKESYRIANFWKESSLGGIIGEAYGIVVESQLGQKVPTQRKMPYYISQPSDLEEEITVVMPEDWNVTPSQVEISGEGFRYSSVASGDANEVKIMFSYVVDRPYIAPIATGDFLEKRDQILNDLTFNLTYTEPMEGFQVNWWLVLFSIAVFLAGIYFAKILFHKYNPEVHDPSAGEGQLIGGWLVVFAIGLTLTPIRLIYGFKDFLDYWNLNTWSGLEVSYDGEIYFFLGLTIIVELLFNISFFVFSILVAMLFYYRRTSAPRLIGIFLISNLIFLILDSYVVGELLQDNTLGDSSKEIVRSVIYTAIWVPYLTYSQRSKATFVKTAG